MGRSRENLVDTMDLGQSHAQVAQSLALREAIKKLSANSEETLKYLNGKDSLWSTLDDPAIICALETLQKCYKNLKTEIFRSSGQPPSKEGLLKFLTKSADLSSSEIVDRYLKENIQLERRSERAQSGRRSWRQLEVDSSRRQKERVPSNVPPLDPDQVKECSIWSRESSSSNLSDQAEVFRESPKIPLKVISDRSIHSSESTSRSSSTSSSSFLGSKIEPILQKSDSENVIDRLKVQSPKGSEQKSQNFGQKASTSHRSHTSEEKITSRFVAKEIKPQKSSRAVQTDPEIVKKDVAIETEPIEHPGSISGSGSDKFQPSMHNSSNSSSYFSSSMSTGQISAQKAMGLSTRLGYKVLSFQTDGSFHARTSVASASEVFFSQSSETPKNNPKSIHLPSTPSRKVQVHEVIEEKFSKIDLGVRNSRNSTPNRPNLGQIPSSNSSITNFSGIYAPEYSIHTSFEMDSGGNLDKKEDEEEVIESLSANTARSHRGQLSSEDSTLDQVSPLPTTG